MTLAYLPAVLLLAGVFFLMAYYVSILRPRKGTLDWVALHDDKPFTFAVKRHRLARKDALPMLLITALYALSAFFSLGNVTAPDYRLAWDLADGQSYTLVLSGQPVYVSGIQHYALLGTGSYDLAVSADGRDWVTLWSYTEPDQWGGEQTVYYWAQAQGYGPGNALPQTSNHMFKWTRTVPTNPQMVKYLRISGRADKDILHLGKLVLLDQEGRPIAGSWTLADGAALPQAPRYALTVDDTVPQDISWRNSGYFDEIYHPRTALEHIQGVYPYEITHPPLGKLILGLGIRMFGMTPFGWRFMGTLFGVGMVPLFYLLLKNIFGKTNLAVCGTILLATEFMHLTQTRIATIDTYGVFFILVSYLFFYRWLTAPATPNRKGKVTAGYGQLALSGLFWGIGCACKWTVIYAGAGLAVLYLIHMVLRLRAWEKDALGRAAGRTRWLWCTLGVSVVFFVAVPAVIYTLSYLPYAQATGDLSLSGVIDQMWHNQSYMLTYHAGVHDYHPYASRWYEWLVDAKPILYYYKDLGNGWVEKFSALTNPLTTWLGLGAIIACLVRCFRRPSATAVFVSVGFAAQFLPWVFIGRVTFAYHYFPSTLFLILAICRMFDDLMASPRARWRWPVYGVTGASTALYLLFYPYLTGLPMPVWYFDSFLKFLPSWV